MRRRYGRSRRSFRRGPARRSTRGRMRRSFSRRRLGFGRL